MSIFGGCSQAWLAFALMLFVVLILRRQCSDGVLTGVGFNVWGAMLLGLGGVVILITLTGAVKWALLSGLGGVIIGGFVLGYIFDSDPGAEGDYE